MIYEIQTFDLIGKIIYVATERPELKKVKGENGQKDYFVNEAGEREDAVRRDVELVDSLGMHKDAEKVSGLSTLLFAKDFPVYLPYFADVTEDVPGSCRNIRKKLKIEDETWKGCQLLRQKHGGYLEFFHHESGKTLRIAMNSNTYSPCESFKDLLELNKKL